MTTSVLYQQIDQLSRDKGIDPAIVVSAVEDAVLVATRKYYKSVEDLRSTFNKDTGHVEVFAFKKVVETVTNPAREISLAGAQKIDPEAQLDGEVKIQKPTDVLGRIAAQTAKQVILQKVREAERDSIFAEYTGRIGEVITCLVKRMEGGDLILDLGSAEGRLPKREQSRLENFSSGDRIRGAIVRVEKTTRGPQVIISRIDPALLRKLFEMEVPEVYDGTVVIKLAARDTGERSKIAVYSKDRDVDPVGACVGMKGSRVQAIIRELHGEKIDIIAYSDDPAQFAINALSPAKISRANIVDSIEKHLEVIVETDQLSLAIGKKGQNVRLAAKLTGWKIDIRSEEEKRAEIEEQMAQLSARTPLSELPALTAAIVQKLIDSGIETIEQLADTPIAELTNIKGVGPKSAEKIIESVKEFYTRQSEEPAEEPTVELTEEPTEEPTSEESAAGSVPQAEESPSGGEDVAATVDVSVELADAAGSTEAESSSNMESENAIDNEASKQEE